MAKGCKRTYVAQCQLIWDSAVQLDLLRSGFCTQCLCRVHRAACGLGARWMKLSITSSDSTLCAWYHSALLSVLMVQGCSSSNVELLVLLLSTASPCACTSLGGLCTDIDRRIELRQKTF